MKRLICIFFSLLFLLAFIYAENEPVPFRKNMKIGKTITLTGSFVLFNEFRQMNIWVEGD